MPNLKDFNDMTPEFMQKALNDYGRRTYPRTPVPPTPPRSSYRPEPIHAILKLIDKSVGISTEFNMNITYETLAGIVEVINNDPIYKQDNKVTSNLMIDIDSFNITKKIVLVERQKTVPFGRKIDI
jgi:hypothetical protein